MKNTDRIPSMDLTGRVALVTGATKGLGYGMAMGLAQAGADIVVVSRTAADCVNVAKEIEAMGKKAIAAPADISIVQGIEKLVSNVIKKIGKIDILVNNAAKGGHFPPFAYLFNNLYFIVLRLLSHASKSGRKLNTKG